MNYTEQFKHLSPEHHSLFTGLWKQRRDFWKSFTNFQGRWKRKKVWRGNQLHWWFTEQLNYWTNMFQLVVFIRVFAGLPSWNTMMISGFRSLYVDSFPSCSVASHCIFCLLLLCSVCQFVKLSPSRRQKPVCPCSVSSVLLGCYIVPPCDGRTELLDIQFLCSSYFLNLLFKYKL